MPVVSTVRVTNTLVHLSGRWPADAFTALNEVLTVRDKVYKTWPVAHWDEELTPLLMREGAAYTFPAGLWRYAEAVFRDHRLAPTIVDERARLPVPETPTVLPSGLTPYPDQVIATGHALFEQRGLLQLATNFGKTAVMGMVAHAHRDKPVLILVNRKTLMHQTADWLVEHLQEPIGRLGDGWRPRSERIVVAMAQTASNRTESPVIQKAAILLVDEVHTVTVKTWFPVLRACPAAIRIGLSGTIREAEHPLLVESFFGPILHEVAETELVEQGRSAKATILMPFTGSALRQSGDYKRLYNEWTLNNPSRNVKIAEFAYWAAAERGLRTVILVYLHDHGKLIQTACEARGLTTRLVTHKSPPGALDAAKADLEARRVQVVIGSPILNVGIDWPAIQALINAAVWKSPLVVRQKLGRGLRRKLDAPNEVFVIDPYDLGNGLIKRHAESRKRTYTKHGFPVRSGPWEEIRDPVPSD